MTRLSTLFPETIEPCDWPALSSLRRSAAWGQFFPAHRLPVLAKTPLLVVLGLYLTGGRFAYATVGATMVLATLLWFFLYALNESTDLALEEGYYVRRRFRILLMGLPILIGVLAACLSLRLVLPFVFTTLGQFLYCVPPMRWKRWWGAILLLSGIMNPILRLECGAIWGVHPIPILAFAAFVSFHLGAALRARVLLRDRDARLSYRVAPSGCETTGILFTALGFLFTFLLCWQGLLPQVSLWFLLPSAAFAIYAWSGRATSVSQLRQGWLGFAILALLALIALLIRLTRF